MIVEELVKENKKLKEENQQLKAMIEKKIVSKNTTAYQIIANIITAKVDKEVHEDFSHCKQALKRDIMNDLKWELHVRYANDLQKEHIEPAREFINNYKIDEYYRKERYKGIV